LLVVLWLHILPLASLDFFQVNMHIIYDSVIASWLVHLIVLGWNFFSQWLAVINAQKNSPE
jgi:hypothetical protein